jgi:hypothetical protein
MQEYCNKWIHRVEGDSVGGGTVRGESPLPRIASQPKQREREEPVKKILSVALAGTVLLFAMYHIQASEPLTSYASSSSQIYIHGTPVCVTQQGKDIVARVGECGVSLHPPDADSLERIPFHGHPGRNLPPGHPPIDQEMFPDGNRRVLI